MEELRAAIQVFKEDSPLCGQLYERAQVLQEKAANARYTDEMSNLCCPLAIRCGKSAWNSLREALGRRVPTFKKLREVAKQQSFCVDCGIDSATLNDQIGRFAARCRDKNYKGPFLIAFDATAIFPSLDVDFTTKNLVGHPFIQQIRVTGYDHYQRLLQECPRAKHLYTFCVTSMTDGAVPPIILLAFPSDDSFDGHWLTRKLREIVQQFKDHGLEVGGFSADGASKQLLSMMIMSDMKQFGSRDIYGFVDFLFADAGKAWMEDKPIMIQDAIHELMKVSFQDTIDERNIRNRSASCHRWCIASREICFMLAIS